MVHLVTWDLNRERANYAQARATFIAHLEQYQHTKDPGLDSVWFISTDHTPDQVNAFLKQRLDQNDRLVVTQLRRGSHQGWLSQAVWDWINARIGA